MKMKKVPKPQPKQMTTSLPNDARTLTVKEVADLDRCSEKTVRRAIDEGMLEAMRVGPGKRLLRITPASLSKYRGAQRT